MTAPRTRLRLVGDTRGVAEEMASQRDFRLAIATSLMRCRKELRRLAIDAVGDERKENDVERILLAIDALMAEVE